MSVIRDILEEAQASERVEAEEYRQAVQSAPAAKVELHVPPGLAAEVRALRENIELLSGLNRVQTIGISGCTPGAGASTVASLLALSMAGGYITNGNGNGQNAQGGPVGKTDALSKGNLLVDSNVAMPRVARLLGISPVPGLAEVLSGSVLWPKVVRLVNEGRLKVITAGRAHPSAAELVTSARMHRLIDEFRDRFNRVIVDLPSAATNVEAVRIGQWLDGVVLVVWAGKTRTDVAREVIERLVAAKVRVLGIVLNRRREVVPQGIY
ncbi:MAG: CpsD/CapB family tyrosine-protein kinase [bacterium]|jgi:Mrp family chromosome partitioning ATPase|nr:CpsD/CapB family tyrosine-protein kinase [candidate division KSB1 bacterium]MDH7558846.1 CpsD/CapB family tyrosine-protein kinase [bacterium]